MDTVEASGQSTTVMSQAKGGQGSSRIMRQRRQTKSETERRTARSSEQKRFAAPARRLLERENSGEKVAQ